MIAALQYYGLDPIVVDPWVDPEEARMEYELEALATIPAVNRYRGVIAAVAHREFVGMPETSWRELLLDDGVSLDLKVVMLRDLNPLRL